MPDRYIRSAKVKTPAECLDCHALLEGVTNVSDQPGKDMRQLRGQVSLCAYCGAIAIFVDDEGRLRKPTEAEMEQIKKQPEIMEIIGLFANKGAAPRRRRCSPRGGKG